MTQQIKKARKIKAVKPKFLQGNKVFLKIPINIEKLETAKHSFFLCPAKFQKQENDIIFLEIDGVEKLITSASNLVLSEKELEDFIKTL